MQADRFRCRVLPLSPVGLGESDGRLRACRHKERNSGKMSMG